MLLEDELLEQVEPFRTKSPWQALMDFAYIPQDRLNDLRSVSSPEDWGQSDFVLKTYLAIHIYLSVIQNAYVYSDGQLRFRVGTLVSPDGSPIYVAFQSNLRGSPPWHLKWTGTRPGGERLPLMASFPTAAMPLLHVENQISYEHVFRDNEKRLPDFLSNLPAAAKCYLIEGALAWSIRNGLTCPTWHKGAVFSSVPLFLRNNQSLDQAPDLVIPIYSSKEANQARTVLLPHFIYPGARALVRHKDALPFWLREAWKAASSGELELD